MPKRKIDHSKISQDFKMAFALPYSPVGFTIADKKPEGALGFKKGGSGCIMPLIFSAARGKTVAFDAQSCGYDCSAFYLGYKDWIFPGIEHFLSSGSLLNPRCERFLKTPAIAKSYIEALKPVKKTEGFTIFKPLEAFSNEERPEAVIFFVNADQISGLVYLLHFNAPQDERVVTHFASACASVATFPLRYAKSGEKKAVWGLHDISARARLPKNLMTLSMPFDLLVEIWGEMDKSFLKDEQWEVIVRRI
ncbi:MAG: DUF169 domain-containing protein [Anaerolineales bacterium]|nr:DUF169 domain-containing protein [Anaerolineales bacterium]